MKNIIVVIIAVLTGYAFALTETVDGITWTYTIKNGGASVGDGQYHYNDYIDGRAVPSTTKGDISIPVTLGGYPVTAIADYAFMGRAIESVTMPNSIVDIGANAFFDCSSLTNVTISGSITNIGNSAFYRCIGLTSVTIPNGVKTIGKGAFYWCSGLTSVIIPDSVTSIRDDTFEFCSGLVSITVGENNANYSSVNGLLLTKDGRQLIRGVNGDVAIPNGVTSIGWNAFRGCANLTNIIIPDSVLTIGRFAFNGCGITNVVMSYGVTRIEQYAFSYCERLKRVTIPASVTYVEEYAFNYCKNLGQVLIPNGAAVADYAFRECYYVSRIYYDPYKTVSFDAQGGSVSPETTTVIFSAKYGALPTPSRDGYSFMGWMLDGNLVSEDVIVSTLDDHSLVAQWKINEYDVVFNANGGSCATEKIVVEHGSQIGTLPTAIRENAEFVGWFDAVPNGKAIGAKTVVANTMTVYAQWCPSRPVVSPIATVFENTSQEVSIACDTDGAMIYYTTDGSDPRENGREYKHPFTIYNTCTVRAIAAKDDWKDSVEATATFTRKEALSAAANLYGYKMESGESAWTVDGEVSHDGVSSIKSNGDGSYVQTSVRGAGTLSFWWRAMCEEPENGEYYDYGVFKVGSAETSYIAGNDTGWVFFSTNIATTGKHTLRWEYRKDDEGTFAPDCVWLDQVQWVPEDGSGYTLTSPEPVPYSWLSQYGLGAASGDFEAAANAASGKMSLGRPTTVWEEFVAGLDPTNENSRFEAKIEMVDGAPVVKWEPDLNTNGIVRIYKVYGRESLAEGEWQYPTNSLHRFFRVDVDMP